MPKSKGIGQAWFYHAPAKPSNADKVHAPPISQIPDLNGNCCLPAEPQKQSRNIIYESDSSYIRLAKQGGRPDLLNMMPPDCGQSGQPVGYPRCDWYYDNVACNQNFNNNDAKSYVFKLPAYMVHPEPEPRQSNDGYVRISDSRVPTVYSRNEPATTDCKLTENANNNVRRVVRKPVKKLNKTEPNPPCKPPSDHLGPNGIHKY